jgi:hypothetical protein
MLGYFIYRILLFINRMTLIFSSVSEILTVQSSTDFSNYVYVNFTAGLGIRNISGKKEKFQELF